MQNLTMTPVESSNVHSIGHVPGEGGKGQTFVAFKNKAGAVTGIYRWDDIPTEAHEAMASAERPGKHFPIFQTEQGKGTKLDDDHPLYEQLRQTAAEADSNG